MAAIKVADIFAQIGARVDVGQLNRFQQRLAQVKRQMLDLKRLAATRLSPNTNIAAVRNLNTELARTVRLSRQIQNTGPIRVAGGAASGARRRGPAGGGFAAGAAGAFGAGKGGFIARNFLGGFTGAIAIRQLFQAQAGLEGIRVALGAVAGPTETGAELFTFLRQESERLGFEFSTSALEFAKLQAAGNAAGLATSDIRNTFIAAQEAARVFNLSVADTEGVLKAFTQIVSKGKVTAEELRNQLGDRLPAAVPLAAKALGVTTEELSLMLEKGEVLANDFLPKFARTIRAEFAGSIQEASQTTSAALNRFLNAWFFVRNAINEGGFGDVLIQFLDGASASLVNLIPFFKIFGFTLKALLSPVLAFFKLIERVDKRIPMFAETILGLIGVLAVWKLAMKAAAIVQLGFLAPWLGLIAAGAAIIILFEDFLTYLDGGDSLFGRAILWTTDKMEELGDRFKFVAEKIDATIAKIRELANLPRSTLADFFEAIDISGNFAAAGGTPALRSQAEARASAARRNGLTIQQDIHVDAGADRAGVREAARQGAEDGLRAELDAASTNTPNLE